LITLAIDTSESRGSVALLRADEAIGAAAHTDGSDYSEWLLVAVEALIRSSGANWQRVELLAVATGPGSFTGVRVGLTAVKGWGEVYGVPVVGVSRLEAVARSAQVASGMIAACYDAQRGQVFGALYEAVDGRIARVGNELVIQPEGLLELAAKEARGEAIHWISLDPQLITGLDGWKEREKAGDSMQTAPTELAKMVGIIAQDRAKRGEFSDIVELDANYVRRSDAEIFWKGPAANVR